MASEHAQLLRESVDDFVARGTDIARVRALRRNPAEYDRAVWQRMAELGWVGIPLLAFYGPGLKEPIMYDTYTVAQVKEALAKANGGSAPVVSAEPVAPAVR